MQFTIFNFVLFFLWQSSVKGVLSMEKGDTANSVAVSVEHVLFEPPRGDGFCGLSPPDTPEAGRVNPEHARMVLLHPPRSAVLVGDGVDADLALEGGELVFGARL